MASSITMKAVGDWSQQMAVPMETALAASIEMTGRSGREAAKRAIIMMAKSARAMTPQAKKNRKIKKDRGGKYVENVRKNGEIQKLYQWMFNPERGREIGTWENAKLIGGRGLAKRSWMWGIKNLVKQPTKPIPGVASLAEFIGNTLSGFILTNRLGYIAKIMPGGYQQTAANKASNQIMAQVAKKMEKKMSIEVPRLAAGRAKKARKLADAWRSAK